MVAGHTPSVVSQADRLTDGCRIAGLLSGYACAVLVALMARVPALERGVGSDRVARWHAMAGRWMVCLLAEPGQFLRWRFLAPGLCWTSSPYSLSTAPGSRSRRPGCGTYWPRRRTTR